MASQIEDWEVADLFCRVFGIDPDSDQAYEFAEEESVSRYGISIEELTLIVVDILPFCAEGRSALTGTHYRGFAADGAFIIKQEVK